MSYYLSDISGYDKKWKKNCCKGRHFALIMIYGLQGKRY